MSYEIRVITIETFRSPEYILYDLNEIICSRYQHAFLIIALYFVGFISRVYLFFIFYLYNLFDLFILLRTGLRIGTKNRVRDENA